MTTTTWPTLPDGRYAALRTTPINGETRNGFVWPTDIRATATAPDWDPNPERECGGGLHALLWGCGSAGLLNALDGVWQVLAVHPDDIATPIADGTPDKIRFRTCEILHAGNRETATAMLVELSHGRLPVVHATATAGYEGTATAGYEGTATAGYEGAVSILWWDEALGKYRRSVAEVGDGGLKPNTPYRLDDAGVFVEVTA